jgi:hypothetical protein
MEHFNVYCIRVSIGPAYGKKKVLHLRGPYKFETAREIFNDYIRKYVPNSPENNRGDAWFGGAFQLNMYSDDWLDKIFQFYGKIKKTDIPDKDIKNVYEVSTAIDEYVKYVFKSIESSYERFGVKVELISKLSLMAGEVVTEESIGASVALNRTENRQDAEILGHGSPFTEESALTPEEWGKVAELFGGNLREIMESSGI